MDRVGVPVDSELKRDENIFFPEDIREIPKSEPPPKQLLSTQAPLLMTKFLKGLEWVRKLSHQ